MQGHYFFIELNCAWFSGLPLNRENMSYYIRWVIMNGGVGKSCFSSCWPLYAHLCMGVYNACVICVIDCLGTHHGNYSQMSCMYIIKQSF